MDVDTYEAELKALGVHGPMGELKRDGRFLLAYKLFDGTTRLLQPSSQMSSLERADVIKGLWAERNASV